MHGFNFGRLARGQPRHAQRHPRASRSTSPACRWPTRSASTSPTTTASTPRSTRGAQLLIVQTSNATFIHTDQIEQQFAITRLRAMETGRWVGGGLDQRRLRDHRARRARGRDRRPAHPGRPGRDRSAWSPRVTPGDADRALGRAARAVLTVVGLLAGLLPYRRRGTRHAGRQARTARPELLPRSRGRGSMSEHRAASLGRRRHGHPHLRGGRQPGLGGRAAARRAARRRRARRRRQLARRHRRDRRRARRRRPGRPRAAPARQGRPRRGVPRRLPAGRSTPATT